MSSAGLICLRKPRTPVALVIRDVHLTAEESLVKAARRLMKDSDTPRINSRESLAI